MAESNNLANQLSQLLFWDVDRQHIDFESQAPFFIRRVLEYGELSDWKAIVAYYGLPRIVAECKQLRTLDPVCLSFICCISHTNPQEYRCYRTAQSNPTPWNSNID